MSDYSDVDEIGLESVIRDNSSTNASPEPTYKGKRKGPLVENKQFYGKGKQRKVASDSPPLTVSGASVAPTATSLFLWLYKTSFIHYTIIIYVKERAEEERREKRNKLKERKEEFRKLLEEAGLNGKSSFSDFAAKYSKDDRFRNIEKMRERESLFDEFLLEVRRREKEEKAAKREQIFPNPFLKFIYNLSLIHLDIIKFD
ncbi:Transcription elongation regulator 1 [Portunus trituberculatus]|uniref:Transcription elongation regulator 1 n=1 Tax=Portunus trituberculatus TaxID=210409 RepID=A0A5B7GJD1_PORTR|nr:Transcription elongation regulator 1 [Portunus trituberculatus]